MSEIKRIFLSSFRLYFAPLVGAFKAVQEEMVRRERARHSTPRS